MNNIRIFICFFFSCMVVKFSIYLNGLVFVISMAVVLMLSVLCMTLCLVDPVLC